MVTTGFYLQKTLQYSPLKSSLVFLFLTAVFGVIAVYGGSWVDRVGLRLPTVIGAFILALGSLVFITLTVNSSLFVVSMVLMILGVGMGLAFAGLNTGIVKTVSEDQVGIGSSVFLMLALIGNSLGVTFTTMIYQKASLSKLLQSFGDLGYEQVQQLATYVANIGSDHQNLSAFNLQLQHAIIEKTTSALGYGISQVMVVNFMVCLIAAVLCLRLLKMTPIMEDTTSQSVNLIN